MALQRRSPLLSDSEIIDIILKYIDEHIYNYAVIIDGEWGCGKTYFVRETLISVIAEYEETKQEDKMRCIIYTSLCRYLDKVLVKSLRAILPNGKYPTEVHEYLKWNDSRILNL